MQRLKQSFKSLLEKGADTPSERYSGRCQPRVLSVIETCKKRGLSALDVISEIVTAVTERKPYPDVFNLTSD
ncbi:hypothetical protein [Parashewanella curva]|uniref:hypothetical protein n=1 Tax=Parashewanella curva TaxID=2338552 RepID=UPI001FB3579E